MAIASYGPEEAAHQAYLRAGGARAAALGNRGPIRFTRSGALHPDILDAYWCADPDVCCRRQRSGSAH